MKKSKKNKTQKNNNNVDSNEIARQIELRQLKIQKVFSKKLQISLKGIWKFFKHSMILGIFKFPKIGPRFTKSFLQ